ncbi:MAG: hypothetical protein UY24_C0043G0011 [Parcubacteria group bacterium GW2011_GWA1_48_11b]|nr:MAG: hypothetical protein UY24_C0043G0011 [Parcubacteria group bacterium GW2011_GWA1_48_11b]
MSWLTLTVTGFVVLVGMVLIAYALVRRSIVIVSTVHCGIVSRFKKRTGRVLDEGLRFVWPFVDSVDLFKLEVVTSDVAESFFSSDQLEVIIKGKVQWRPDKRLVSSKFVEMSEDTITKGLIGAIKAELGIIAGQKEAEAFIGSREAVGLLINCVLRMEEPFHIIHAALPSTRLDFYVQNGNNVRDHLRDEHKLVNNRSDIEAGYGIDILKFELEDVDFSPATKKVMESKKQVVEKLKANQLALDKKMQMIEDFKAKGLDPQAAVNAAELALEESRTTRQIFSVEGLDKLKGLLSLTQVAPAPTPAPQPIVVMSPPAPAVVTPPLAPKKRAPRRTSRPKKAKRQACPPKRRKRRKAVARKPKTKQSRVSKRCNGHCSACGRRVRHRGGPASSPACRRGRAGEHRRTK